MFDGLMSTRTLENAAMATGRLATSVDDLAGAEIGQALEHALGALAENLLARPAAQLLDFAVDAVQTAALAELHGDRYRARGDVLEGAVILADVGGRALSVEVELAEYLFAHFGVGVRRYNLRSVRASARERGREGP